MGGIDRSLGQFISRISPSKVKCVATFGTSALKKESDREIEKRIREMNIPVSNHRFHCRGAFSAMHKGHPTDEDLEQAAAFALSVVAENKDQ